VGWMYTMWGRCRRLRFRCTLTAGVLLASAEEEACVVAVYCDWQLSLLEAESDHVWIHQGSGTW
jgi:hypothetical protein